MLLPLLYRTAIPVYYRRFRKFINGTKSARKFQRKLLFEKIRRHAQSDFGSDHGFSSIQTVEDFRRQVPIANYEYYSPYVERVKSGDVNAMFSPGTRILMFALTSGTTNKSKFIPVTQEFFDEYRRSWFTWGARTFHNHKDQVQKLTIQLSSDWQQFETESGIPCGNISGLAAELRPWISRLVFMLPYPVIKISDAASKHYTALRLAMASRRIGMIITANPSTLIEFARRASDNAESIIRDIHDGTLSSDVSVSSDVRKMLHRFTSQRNPQRAHELERIAEQSGRLYPKDFWPSLSVLSVWMGGSVGVYLPRLKEFYGETALRDHGLSASEGRMTIPIGDGTCAGVLDYVSHYYEFVPEEEIDSEQPTILEAHELERDKNYYILLTTSSGLYRYDIHDVVRCVDFEGEVPVLEFLNKGANFSSITGEKLSEHQVVSAVTQAYSELGLEVETFTVAPVMEGGRPGYILLLEPPNTTRDNSAVARQVDSNLRELNCEYGDKIDSGRLHPLDVKEIASGSWAAMRSERTSERGNFEEYKHPCLANNLEFVGKMTKRSTTN